LVTRAACAEQEEDVLRYVTRRTIEYYNVDIHFVTFPPGCVRDSPSDHDRYHVREWVVVHRIRLDPYREKPNFTRRGKWNYHHMIR
jgi:hypothetical protein